MKRPTAAVAGAAIVSVALALGVGYAAFPARTAGLSVPGPRALPVAQTAGQAGRHQVRAHPAKEGRIVSPFLPEHPTREQERHAAAMAAPRRGAGKAAAAVPAPKEQAMRLAGIVSSATGRRAILSVGGRQMILSPGEARDGVALASLTWNAATVSTPSGERTLMLRPKAKM